MLRSSCCLSAARISIIDEIGMLLDNLVQRIGSALSPTGRGRATPRIPISYLSAPIGNCGRIPWQITAPALSLLAGRPPARRTHRFARHVGDFQVWVAVLGEPQKDPSETHPPSIASSSSAAAIRRSRHTKDEGTAGACRDFPSRSRLCPGLGRERREEEGQCEPCPQSLSLEYCVADSYETRHRHHFILVVLNGKVQLWRVTCVIWVFALVTQSPESVIH